MIKTVLFDLGNVFISVEPDHFWEKLGLRTLAQRSPYDTKVRSASQLFERGEISANEFFVLQEGMFEKKFTLPQLHAAFDSILITPIEGMELLVTNVQTRARTALVSNTNAVHWEACLKNIRVLSKLQAHYLSYEIKAMKPDPNFYAYVIKKEKFAPEEMLFVDDVEENVKGAEKAGMRAHQFTTVARLSDALKQYGVI